MSSYLATSYQLCHLGEHFCHHPRHHAFKTDKHFLYLAGFLCISFGLIMYLAMTTRPDIHSVTKLGQLREEALVHKCQTNTALFESDYRATIALTQARDSGPARG